MSRYHQVDQPSLIKYMFYPREHVKQPPENAFDFFVTVDEGVSIVCRFHIGNQAWPWILLFHGNGEVASDYDEIAPLYHRRGINLVVADYRGYGASDGIPTFANLVKDAHTLFRAIEQKIIDQGFQKEIWLMGRSLGSISVLELCSRYPDSFEGMIIESGFTCVTKIIDHLGLPFVDIDLMDLEKECIDKAESIQVPALIIHGGLDNLVPLWQAEELYQYLGTSNKKIVIVPGGDHNNLMLIGMDIYFGSIQQFVYTAVE